MKSINYDKLIQRLKKKYSFAKDVSIEVVDSYGRTEYVPSQNSIVVYIGHIKQFYKTKRFHKRLGKVTLNKAIILTLLHEIHHIYQEQTVDPQVLLAEKLAINDSEKHDSSWIEKEADIFAKKEIKKWA